jgi:hypothetical protein
MGLQRRIKKKRPSQFVRKLREQRRQEELRQEAAKQQEVLRQQRELLLSMPKHELLAFALRNDQDPLRQVARELLAQEEGRPWKAIRQSAQQPKPGSSVAPPGAAKKTRSKKRTGKGQRKTPTVWALRVPAVPSNLGHDYLRPLGEDGMPEYDLE